MKLWEKTLDSKTIYEGKIITVKLDDVLLENGAGAKREVVLHPGGVTVAAINENNEIALVRQFRYPYMEIVPELPAGKLEPGEDPDEAIKRELREEVGATGKNWRRLGDLYPTPGYCAEIIRLYACDIDEMGQADPDEDEFLSAEFVSLDKLTEMVLSGEIKDAKTQAIILRLAFERK